MMIEIRGVFAGIEDIFNQYQMCSGSSPMCDEQMTPFQSWRCTIIPARQLRSDGRMRPCHVRPIRGGCTFKCALAHRLQRRCVRLLQCQGQTPRPGGRRNTALLIHILGQKSRCAVQSPR